MDFTLKDFWKIVESEHQKAIEKHPVFCTELCEISEGSYNRLAESQKESNDQDEKEGVQYGDNVVMEEIYETFDAAYRDDVEAMVTEAAQACQTLYRACAYKIIELEKNKQCKAYTN